MGNVQFRNGKVLFTAGGAVAMDPRCCCRSSNACTTCSANQQNAMGVSVTGHGVTGHEYEANVLGHTPGSFDYCYFAYVNIGCGWQWTATFDLAGLGYPGFIFDYAVTVYFEPGTGKFSGEMCCGTWEDGHPCDQRLYAGPYGWLQSNPSESNTIACGPDGKLHGSITLHGVYIPGDNIDARTWTATVTLP
jgi:hypothetical protein